MPNSSDVFNVEISSIIRSICPATVFDIGIGSGKYGELLQTICPSSIITGCEIDSDYLIEYKQRHSFYKKIINKSILDIIDVEEFDVDLVIMGDVLEHLKHSQVIDVLDYFQYRSKYMLCVYPSHLKQGIWNGHISERHMSDLNLNELVSKYDVWEYKKKYDTFFIMNLTLLKGYLN